eukprot:556018_1
MTPTKILCNYLEEHDGRLPSHASVLVAYSNNSISWIDAHEIIIQFIYEAPNKYSDFNPIYQKTISNDTLHSMSKETHDDIAVNPFDISISCISVSHCSDTSEGFDNLSCSPPSDRSETMITETEYSRHTVVYSGLMSYRNTLNPSHMMLKKRYFELTNAMTLLVYDYNEDESETVCIDLTDIQNIAKMGEREFQMKTITGQWEFSCHDIEEREQWFSIVNELCF